MDPIIGMVVPIATPFAPRGWALCNGQLLAISEHQALFSIIGTTYGGDGRVTFALPDLRGRVPIHAGHPGRSRRALGERGGAERLDPPFVWVAASDVGVEAAQRQGEDLAQPSVGVHYAIAMVGLYPARADEIAGQVADGPEPAVAEPEAEPEPAAAPGPAKAPEPAKAKADGLTPELASAPEGASGPEGASEHANGSEPGRELAARVARLEETAARLLKEAAALATEAARLRAELED